MNPFLLSLLIFLFLSLPAWSDANETFTFGRFGTVAIYHDSPHPSADHASLPDTLAGTILREAHVTTQGGMEA